MVDPIQAANAASVPVPKPQRLSGVKGMNDILPPDSALWERFEETVRSHMAAHAYRNIRTPIVEPTALFVRGTGQGTDIVEKEMYSFQDRLNGEELTLRPENTPGVVRAAIEHNLTYDGGKRLYYFGPMFRHERPQRGRYRQFHQLGAEALGFGGPEVDAELMVLVHGLLAALGVSNVRVELNSLGLPAERHAHRAALIAHLERHADALDDDARRRLHTNPLRILDTKHPALQEVVNAAPRLIDHLGDASLRHLQTVQTLLDACGVPWRINPRLVRGLDYYSHTVFEFITDELGAQGTLCGGGRYDGLFELLGGKPTPAVGWGMGVERVLELMRTQQAQTMQHALDAYAVVPDPAALPLVMPLLQMLRSYGLRVQMHAGAGTEGGGSMKSQFKKADASGARFALVFGADELGRGELTVKALRDGSGAQRLERLDAVATWAPTLQSPD